MSGVVFSISEGKFEFFDNADNRTREIIEIDLEKYAVPVLLGIVFIIGVVGNGAVFVTTCKDRKFRNVPNSFIQSITLVNFLTILICIPMLATSFVMDKEWPFGLVACKMLYSVPQAGLAISMLSLVGLSIERYAAFAAPPKNRSVARRRSTIGILIIWIIGVSCGLPLSIFSFEERIITPVETPKYKSEETDVFCREFNGLMYPPSYAQVHTVVSICFLFILPLIVILSFYCSLSCVVCAKKHHDSRIRDDDSNTPLKVHGTRSSRSGTLTKTSTELTTKTNTIRTADSRRSQTGTLRSNKRTGRRRKTMAKVAIYLTMQYTVLWTPRFAFLLRLCFYKGEMDMVWGLIQLGGTMCIYINAALVPFMIVALNRGFRRQLGKYLCCCFSCTQCCCVGCKHHEENEKYIDGSLQSEERENKSSCCACCYRKEAKEDNSLSIESQDFPDGSLFNAAQANLYQEPVGGFYESNTLPAYQYGPYHPSSHPNNDIYAAPQRPLPARTSYPQAMYEPPHSVHSFNTSYEYQRPGFYPEYIPEHRTSSYPNIRAESPKFSRTYMPGQDDHNLETVQNMRELPAL